MIIHITPSTLIAPEKSFHTIPGETTWDLFMVPRPARTVLAITEGVTVQAEYHPHSQTYSFTWHGQAYRALANPGLPGIPVVLEASEGGAS